MRLRIAYIDTYFLQIRAQVFSEFQRNSMLEQDTLRAGAFSLNICGEVPICYTNTFFWQLKCYFIYILGGFILGNSEVEKN